MTRRSPSKKTIPFVSDTLPFVAMMPVAVVSSFLTGDMKWVMAAGLVIPAIVLLLRIFVEDDHAKEPTDDLTGLPLRKAMETAFDQVFAVPGNAVRTSACVVVDLDSFHAFNERWGREAAACRAYQFADRVTCAFSPSGTSMRSALDQACSFRVSSTRPEVAPFASIQYTPSASGDVHLRFRF